MQVTVFATVVRAGFSWVYGSMGVVSGGSPWIHQDRERQDAPQSSYSPRNPYDLYVRIECQVLVIAFTWLVTPYIIQFHYTGKSFVEMVRYLFTLPDDKSFLSQRICHHPPLERFFGCQRQRGGVHDNPKCSEFMKNTQALHVINGLQAPKKGNCRGGDMDKCKENWCSPLPKRKRLRTHRLTFHAVCIFIPYICTCLTFFVNIIVL